MFYPFRPRDDNAAVHRSESQTFAEDARIGLGFMTRCPVGWMARELQRSEPVNC